MILKPNPIHKQKMSPVNVLYRNFWVIISCKKEAANVLVFRLIWIMDLTI